MQQRHPRAAIFVVTRLTGVVAVTVEHQRPSALALGAGPPGQARRRSNTGTPRRRIGLGRFPDRPLWAFGFISAEVAVSQSAENRRLPRTSVGWC